jgi:hypothetical protein
MFFREILLMNYIRLASYDFSSFFLFFSLYKKWVLAITGLHMNHLLSSIS